MLGENGIEGRMFAKGRGSERDWRVKEGKWRGWTWDLDMLEWSFVDHRCFFPRDRRDDSREGTHRDRSDEVETRIRLDDGRNG